MAASDFNRGRVGVTKLDDDKFYSLVRNRYEICADAHAPILLDFTIFVLSNKEHKNFFWIEHIVKGFRSYEDATLAIENFNREESEYYIDESSIAEFVSSSGRMFAPVDDDDRLMEKFWIYVKSVPELEDRTVSAYVSDENLPISFLGRAL